MSNYELIEHTDGQIILRDAFLGHRGAMTNSLVGVAVDEDGVPLYGEHSSQRIISLAGITKRIPLRMDPERGLVVAGGKS